MPARLRGMLDAWSAKTETRIRLLTPPENEKLRPGAARSALSIARRLRGRALPVDKVLEVHTGLVPRAIVTVRGAR